MKLTFKQTKNFFKKINVLSNGCWGWGGYRKPNGEAWTNIEKFIPARNIMWNLCYERGIPKCKTVYHMCKNKSCINPDHLGVESKHEKEIRIFWEKANREEEYECWEWLGCVGDNGYGQGGTKDNRYLAHRFAWQFHYGEIPKGMLVCHHCDNPSCVNPIHLFLGTQKDNIRDMDKKGRRKLHWKNPKIRGEKNPNSKLTEKSVLEIIKLRKTMTLERLSKKYKVCPNTILNICNGKTWKHMTKL